MSDRPMFAVTCVSWFTVSLLKFAQGDFNIGALCMGAGIVYVLLATRRS